MCDSQVIRLTPPTLPSLLSILKDIPVRQYAQAGHFYHSMRVLVKTLLVLMTYVISEGSGEHVCLHNLVSVSLTNKVYSG